MRIVSLSANITENIIKLGGAGHLVGVTQFCELPEGVSVERIQLDAHSKLTPQLLAKYSPELVFGDIYARTAEEVTSHVKQFIPPGAKYLNFAPLTLEAVYTDFERLGKLFGAEAQGRAIGQRLKAQLMDWGSNLYDRMKNKRVAILNHMPLGVPARFVPDLVKLASCTSLPTKGLLESNSVRWEEVLAFRPDVILVAPLGMGLKSSMASFRELERLTDWDTLPAVKRGEVYFASGEAVKFVPTYKLIGSAAVLFSAIAGFDSGYITERDSYQRLRWLEMHRDKY
jgi:iron complex transport system substrate-binding protein